MARLAISSSQALRSGFRFLKRTPARMPGSERRRGRYFIASSACFGRSDPVVSLDDGFLEGGQSPTPGIRHGRRVHAVTIPTEVAEIGRRDATLRRLLSARRVFELTVQLHAQRAQPLARLLGQSSCSNNPHREGRNRSVDSPAVRPLRARCAPAGLSGASGRLQKAISGRRTTLSIVRGRWLRLASTCEFMP
jgi:hypothetical protein